MNADNSTSGETILLGSHPTQPCPAPSNTVDCIPSDGGSHSIGTVRSAPDGTLWIGSGDGADYGGVDERALRTHNEQSFGGKLIHVDRDGRGLPGHPFCPAVTDLSQVCTKVWAKGFRNPFRFTIRPNGLPAVGDVGWGSWEELNLAQAGRNYGWPCYEGRSRPGGYSGFATCKDFLFQGGHDGGWRSPTTSMPTARGRPSSAVRPTPAARTPTSTTATSSSVTTSRASSSDSSSTRGKPTGTKDFVTGWFGVDIELRNGELYYVDFGDGGSGSGSVVRIAYSPNNSTPIAVATATPTFGPAPLKVTFKGSGSSDPDGDALKYEWDFGDGTAKSTSKDPVHTYLRGGNYDARLKVTDSRAQARWRLFASRSTIRRRWSRSPRPGRREVPRRPARAALRIGDRPQRRHAGRRQARVERGARPRDPLTLSRR